MPTTHTEREGFTRRLLQSLENVGLAGIGPTQLQREFNLRSPSNVTVHAARKWLVGDAIPVQEKLKVLAYWLDVSPDWLRYGNGQQAGKEDSVANIQTKYLKTVNDLANLSDTDRKIVEEMILILLKARRNETKSSKGND